MANFLQILNIAAGGAETVYHPETSADYVLDSSTKKIPTIVNINDWLAKSLEIEGARKGELSLGAKITSIDTKLTAANLLTSIKTVDGTGSGLDADKVDGREVNDSDLSANSIWTSQKVQSELNTKLEKTDVVTVATANKVLKLDSNGEMVVNIKGSSTSALGLRYNAKNILINNISTTDSLWTSDRVIEEIRLMSDEIIRTTQAKTNEIIINGVTSIKFGEVDITGLTTVNITFPVAFSDRILMSDFSIVALDSAVRVIHKTHNANGIVFTLNKAATDGKLSYSAIGV